jgi:phthiodiolone/phenolphthiodiolone dimycocerosates ketoreductase
MTLRLAAFLLPGLPLDLSVLPAIDNDRTHSVFLPDHLVSFWPDSIWTPEFTDLATVSPSPHRCLDSLAVAAAVGALTRQVSIATSVVDTVRRHPAMLAQTALTLDHLSRGRFILGLGSGETENTVPYGFDFARSVSRLEESLKIIRLLWDTDGPVDFQGEFYRLKHARLDTEPFEGRFPRIWMGSGGPRMLEITGRYAEGWWPTNAWTPEEYAQKLGVVRHSAERAGRDPLAIEPAIMQTCFIADDDAQLAEILSAPLVKAWMLMPSAEVLGRFGMRHPFGDNWRGYQDIDPALLPRERVIELLDRVRPEMIMALVPCGTPRQVARQLKGFVEAGVRVINVMDNGAMAGLKFAATSATRVRKTENELLRLVGAGS